MVEGSELAPSGFAVEGVGVGALLGAFAAAHAATEVGPVPGYLGVTGGDVLVVADGGAAAVVVTVGEPLVLQVLLADGEGGSRVALVTGDADEASAVWAGA